MTRILQQKRLEKLVAMTLVDWKLWTRDPNPPRIEIKLKDESYNVETTHDVLTVGRVFRTPLEVERYLDGLRDAACLMGEKP